MLKNLINLLYPKACYACNGFLHDNEQDICTFCRHDLPITNFHFNNDEAIARLLYGRVKLQLSTALFYFEKKSLVQQLIHNLKYRGHENIGLVLGKWLGEDLKQLPEFKLIDMVIPVPLHKNKLKKRGYNQVTKFAQELALALNAEYVDNVLLKITDTTSQVKKKRFSRWNSKNNVLSVVDAHKISGKHLLLVDDIITTGATIEACAIELSKVKNITLSVAVIAMA